jgi:V8-like Glu-specific endopeptidase
MMLKFVRPRLTPLLLSLFVLTSCSPYEPWDPPDELLESMPLGIVGGMSTSGWPAVGAYLINGGYGLCTATLVDPEVLLTAAHCIDGAGPNDLFYVGGNINNASWNDLYEIDDAIDHPQYNPNSNNPHDVAVLLLRDPITDIEPIPVNTTAFTNQWIGDWFHYVGFGSNTTYSGGGAGQKREADIQVYDYYTYEYIHYSNSTNTCAGDSGGPGLVDLGGQWHVAGVNSSVFATEHGEDPCHGGGFEMRVDAELSFLDDYFDPYQGQTDDDDASDDDDDSDDDDNGDDDVGDDDTIPPLEDLPEPNVSADYDQPQGCACDDSRATQSPWVVALTAALGLWTVTRRRR